MSYLVYLNHYNIRQCRAQYLSVLYEVLGKGLDAHFILSNEYLDYYPNRWETRWAKEQWGSIEVLRSNLTPENCTKMKKPEEILASSSIVPSEILRLTVEENIPTQIDTIMEVLEKKEIKAGITWVNNSCFKRTLWNTYQIPTIHHELGPFRSSTYIPTAYLDFSGVNGNTEFEERFRKFLKIADNVPILTQKELIRVLSPNCYKELWKVLENKEFEYEAGVGLQVEVDTNLLLFNKGRHWVDPILEAESKSSGRILVRPHPNAGYKLSPIDGRIIVDDLKEPAYSFINKCKKIYCLNSSIGVEAFLIGREAAILGDSPFNSLCEMNEETLLKALNFIVFGYLIHRELLFNGDYYEFRLKERGNEELIYKDNVKRLIKKGLKTCS